MTRGRQVALGLGCVLLGVLGMLLGQVMLHLWADHRLLHNIQSFLNSQIEQASKTPQPQPLKPADK